MTLRQSEICIFLSLDLFFFFFIYINFVLCCYVHKRSRTYLSPDRQKGGAQMKKTSTYSKQERAIFVLFLFVSCFIYVPVKQDGGRWMLFAWRR